MKIMWQIVLFTYNVCFYAKYSLASKMTSFLYLKKARFCNFQDISFIICVCIKGFLFSGCICKYSGGCSYYYPAYHVVRAPHLVEKFEVDLRRYLVRKIGFESVMRIRCSKGKSFSMCWHCLGQVHFVCISCTVKSAYEEPAYKESLL